MKQIRNFTLIANDTGGTSICRGSWLGTALFIVVCCGLTPSDVDGVIPPPDYVLTDHNQVNMATGQVAPSLTDVSIGGKMGLSHTISTDGSEFVNHESRWGPRDSFYAGLRTTPMPKRFLNDVPGNDVTLPTEESRWKLTAYFGGSAVSFYINGDGSYIGDSGTFTAERDLRHQLEYRVDISAFVHTAPDGTEVYYEPSINLGESATAYFHRAAKKIVYPNGFTVYLDYLSGPKVSSVRTNTGFQLKYIYNRDVTGLSSVHQQELNRIKNQLGRYYMEVNPGTWTTLVPSAVIGLNNAIEVCDPANDTCTTQQTWPTATYQWPSGMPAAMYLGKTEFRVTDAEGRVTVYIHEPQDKSTGHSSDLPANVYFVPRITEIKQAHEKEPFIQYEYYNQGTFSSGSGNGLRQVRWQASEHGVLKKALRGDSVEHYYIADRMEQHGTLTAIINGSSAYQGVEAVITHVPSTVAYEIRLWDKTIYLNQDRYNRIRSVSNKVTATGETFEYDSRGNITQKTVSGGGSQIVVKAEYPETCSNPKTCNQAIWMEDALGNRTDYTYHSESGQVATVTLPAPTTGGVRPQTRYRYEQKTATFKDTAGQLRQAEDPIWMLVEESYCRNGAAHSSGQGCQLGATDEVKTAYEYEENNLLVKGVVVQAVNAANQIETRRTCYRYDRYGNRISETLPKANLNACP